MQFNSLSFRTTDAEADPTMYGTGVGPRRAHHSIRQVIIDMIKSQVTVYETRQTSKCVSNKLIPKLE